MAVYKTGSNGRDGASSIVETIEVRPWWVGGKRGQEFVIGGGGNFTQNSNILIEIIYSVNEVQLFYTRNFIHNVDFDFHSAHLHDSLDKFMAGERDGFGFGDMLPETSVFLKREKYSGGPDASSYYRLEISADIGAGIGKESPGMRKINISADLEESDGFDFMRQLVNEIAGVHEENHPDPAQLPAGSSNWSFARQVNQKAYDQIAAGYAEDYFSEPILTGLFDAWLGGIPAGSHILDVGCGHGKPVISRLLEKGYRVTGADLSPKMLERAQQNFPGVFFVNQLAGEMTFESQFEGACSLSSLLYLDPIDLSQGLYRLWRALKPDGLLYLHAYDLHPGYRGQPYHQDLDQWMWGWTYGLEEAVCALEEHGYFKVLNAQDATSEQEKQERIDRWYRWAREEYDANLVKYPHAKFTQPDRGNPPALSYKYVIVAQACLK